MIERKQTARIHKDFNERSTMIAARLSSGALQKQETGVGADFFFKKCSEGTTTDWKKSI